MLRSIDDAHAAAPEQTLDAVAGKLRADPWRRSHGLLYHRYLAISNALPSLFSGWKCQPFHPVVTEGLGQGSA